MNLLMASLPLTDCVDIPIFIVEPRSLCNTTVLQDNETGKLGCFYILDVYI